MAATRSANARRRGHWRSLIAASLAAVCAAVLATVLYADHDDYRRRTLAAFQDRQLAALRIQAAAVEELLARQVRDLKYLSQDPDVALAKPSLAEKLQAYVAVHRPLLVNVGRTDAEGQVVFQAARDAKRQDFSTAPEFASARQTGLARLGLGSCADAESGARCARVLVPILTGGRFSGVIFACMDLEAVWRKCLPEAHDTDAGAVWAVDGGQTILHHPNKGYLYRTWADIEEGLGNTGGSWKEFRTFCRRVAGGEEGKCRFLSPAGGGTEVLAAFAPVRALDRRWGLAAVTPEAALAGTLDAHARLTHALIAAMILVFAAGGAAAARAGRAMLAPTAPSGEAVQGSNPTAEEAPPATIRDLQAARLAAENANRAKSEFLANMSHEIRTPLTAILGFADLLDDPGIEPAEARDWLAAIRRNGRHLLTLIGGILDLSKIEAGKRAINPHPCNLLALVGDAVEMMRGPARQAGLLLAAEYVGELPETISADEAALRQILLNLLGNAVKFTERGSVRATVSFVPAWRGGTPAVKVQVADTGVGIAPRQLRRIDEAFYQAPSGAAATAEGTGLGLTIARHLIEMHGGELTIHSTPGEGSVFTFVIPTGPLAGVRMLPGTPADPADTDRCALADAPGPLGRLRILVAEDSPDNRRLIAAVLRKAGARVQFAENGASAVRMASENPFDLILMDIEMPGMDGKEAAAALRRKGATVPIIALTAHALAGDRDECLAAGCTDYLTKPIDRTLLVETVARHAKRDSRAA